MRKITILLCCLASLPVFAQKKKSTTTGDKRFAGLDTVFARVLKEWNAAGFAVAVVEKDSIVYAKGFGYKDYENKQPVTENTLFAIGSCSKAFTSSLIGLLQKDGKLEYDKPVREYIPELNFYNDDLTNHVTVRDIMCHRTGLPRHDYSWYYFGISSADSMMKRIRYMEPTAPLRQTWQYNNFMFFLQGQLAEKLTGASWEQNIQNRIFKPINMATATLNLKDWVNSADKAYGYTVKKDSIISRLDYFDIGSMAPAGSINSGVKDMGNWLITWINGGKFKGKEILPSQYVSEAISSQMVIRGALPSKEKPDLFFANYGFGWFMSSYKGHYRVEHGGNIDGFSASTSFFPTDSIGIVVLCNQDGSAIPSVVRNIMADRMLGLPYFDWQTDQKSGVDKAKAAAKDAEKSIVNKNMAEGPATHPLKDYTGLYSNPGYGALEVYTSGDSLMAKVGKFTWWMQHTRFDIFTPSQKDREGNFDTTEKNDPVQFNMTSGGEIESVSINFEPGLKPIVFSRTIQPKAMTKEALQPYTGEYDLGGQSLKVYIKGENTLFLFVPGQPEYELVAIDKDKFSIKILKGFTVLFNRNENGEISELVSQQPNGSFKAVKKK